MSNTSENVRINPFDNAFEMLGQVPEVITEDVNAEALNQLTKALTSRAGKRGRVILLRAPRAGFGKTHLLMRLHQNFTDTHEFIALEPSKGRYLDAQLVLGAVLRRFLRVADGNLTVLDILARKILAAGLEPLVKSGEVPCQDSDSALKSLQGQPVETFDFHNEQAVTAQWARANFSELESRLSSEIARLAHADHHSVAWWVELLFHYSSSPADQARRNRSLLDAVLTGDHTEADLQEKLVTLLNLTGLVSSPVLVLDEVEGFSGNPEAALQVATFLNALHQSCNKLTLIISANDDVWESAFLPRMSCGLKDRLSDIVVDLKPMDKEIAALVLRDRAGVRTDDILEAMDFDTEAIYARGLIRKASEAWEGLDWPNDESGFMSLGEDEELGSFLVRPAPEVKEDEIPEVKVDPGAAKFVPQIDKEPHAIPADAMPAYGSEPSPDELFGFNAPSVPVTDDKIVSEKESPFSKAGESNSPFTIDNGTAAEQSPFQPIVEQNSEQLGATNTIDNGTAAEQSPFQPIVEQNSEQLGATNGGDGAESPSEINQPGNSKMFSPAPSGDETEKVDNLLQEFRDQYGRE